MAKDDRLSEYKLAVPCPCCDKTLRIRGHNKNSWHRDSTGKSLLRKYYVSCSCGIHLLEQVQTLTPVVHPRAIAGSMALTIETRAIPLETLNLERA